jgi:hypothetical protein
MKIFIQECVDIARRIGDEETYSDDEVIKIDEDENVEVDKDVVMQIRDERSVAICKEHQKDQRTAYIVAQIQEIVSNTHILLKRVVPNATLMRHQCFLSHF